MKQYYREFYKILIEKSLDMSDTRMMFRYVYDPLMFFLIFPCILFLLIIIDSDNHVVFLLIEFLMVVLALLLPFILFSFVFITHVNEEKIRRNILMEVELDEESTIKHWKWQNSYMKVLYGLWILVICGFTYEIIRSISVEFTFGYVMFLFNMLIFTTTSLLLVLKRNKRVLQQRKAVISKLGINYVGDIYLWEKDSGNSVYSMRYYPRNESNPAIYVLKLELWGRYGQSLHDFVFPISLENESRMDSIQQIVRDQKREQDDWKKSKLS